MKPRGEGRTLNKMIENSKTFRHRFMKVKIIRRTYHIYEMNLYRNIKKLVEWKAAEYQGNYEGHDEERIEVDGRERVVGDRKIGRTAEDRKKRTEIVEKGKTHQGM